MRVTGNEKERKSERVRGERVRELDDDRVRGERVGVRE